MEKILLLVSVSSEIFILSSCLLIRQYYFIDQRLTWTDAQTFCRQKHTDLATIKTSEEMDGVMTAASSAGYSSKVWIGLYSNINWRWSDGFTGVLIDHSYWSSEDSFHSRSDQICMVADWQHVRVSWSDLNCSSLFPFVCYYGTQQNPEYVFVNERMNWSSAQRYCRQNFTDLATMRRNSDWIKFYSVTDIDQKVWTGFNRDSNLSWSDGSNFFFYQKPTKLYLQPGVTSVRCGFLYVRNTNDWYLYPCENRLPFVCYDLLKVKKRVVKLRLKTENSDVLNDAIVKANLLEKLQDKLKENGVSGVEVKWRQTTDGKVFNQEEKEKTEL